VVRGVLAANLDANVGGVVVQVGNEHFADQLVEMAVFLHHRFDLLREGPGKAVSHEDAEEGADQRATNHLAQNLWRLVNRTHGLDHTKHGRNDAERWQGVGNRLKRMAAQQCVMKIGLELLFQHLFHLMRVVVVHRGGAQGVTNQPDGLMILEDFRVLAKNGRDLGRFNVFLNRDRVLPRKPDQFKQQAQQIAKIGGLPFCALKNFQDIFERVLDRGEVARDYESADRRAADNDHFVRQGMQHDFKVPARQHKATKDHHEDDDNAYDADHALASVMTRSFADRR